MPLSSRQLEKLLSQIRAVRSPGRAKLAWLYEQAQHESGAVRYAAISALAAMAEPTELRSFLFERLETESDQDVLIPVLSALSIGAQGSRDAALVARLRAALSKFGRVYSGTRASFEDAALRIMEGLDSRAIATLSAKERGRLLEGINDSNAKALRERLKRGNR